MPIFILVLYYLLSTQVIAHQLTAVNSHWPPWRVLKNDGSISGIEVDILKRLSTRLEMPLVTKACGWKRCLKYMQLGEGDVMTGLLKTAERDKYMKFVEPAYRDVKSTCFYQNDAQKIEINNYQDLYGMTIGVIKKVTYFEPFNSDDKLTKHYSTTDINLFRLLKAKNIDAVIMDCAVGDIRLKSLALNSEIKHADYVHNVANPVYLAISRKSELFKREQEVSQALRSMIETGEIRDIMSSYGILSVE